MENLKRRLSAIDGRGYRTYRSIEGSYHFPNFRLFIDQAQVDPFASPSRMRIRVPQEKAGFPGKYYQKKICQIALEDYLIRRFAQAIRDMVRGRRGSGKSGTVKIDTPDQEVLGRSAMVVNEEFVEARFFLGLPAQGRRISAREAQEMFFTELPRIVSSALLFLSLNKEELEKHLDTVEIQEELRKKLREKKLVAFVGEGSLLPRKSGVDPRPMERKQAILFQTPPTLSVTIDLGDLGSFTGMGIPEGVILIAGGGYHGKSTLLNALELGIYNHIPGDGRELVVAESTTVKIRSEDGRYVERVNISPFINNLPLGQETDAFSTPDASGSTSQAANIIEALEIGCKLLLVDEDTSATNFMIRDERMQKLVAKEKEPITPFIDKVRQLYQELGVSTILVMGGSGDYLDVVDAVIVMEEYLLYDRTEKAREINKQHTTKRRTEGGDSFGTLSPRIPIPQSFDPSRGRKREKVKAKEIDEILFGRHEIDLKWIEQIVSRSQTRAIADSITYALNSGYINGKRNLKEIVTLLEKDIGEKGLDIISFFIIGHHARPRRFEVACAINRLRTLKCR